MKGEIEINLEDRHPLTIVHLSGSIAAMGVYKVKATLDVALKEGTKYFILDLVEVTFLDSAGIGLLLQIRNGCHLAGGAVVLVNSKTTQVTHTLQISSLGKMIPFFDSIRDALEYAHAKYGIVLPETSGSLMPGELADMVRHLSERLTEMENRIARLEAREEGRP